MLLLAQVASDEALKVLGDGVSTEDVVLMIAGGVVLVAVLVLKMLNKSVPILDPILTGALKLLSAIRKPKPPAEPEERDVKPLFVDAAQRALQERKPPSE
jgi:hypothetical protein